MPIISFIPYFSDKEGTCVTCDRFFGDKKEEAQGGKFAVIQQGRYDILYGYICRKCLSPLLEPLSIVSRRFEIPNHIPKEQHIDYIRERISLEKEKRIHS